MILIDPTSLKANKAIRMQITVFPVTELLFYVSEYNKQVSEATPNSIDFNIGSVFLLRMERLEQQ